MKLVEHALYEGQVMHTRHTPVRNVFNYRMFMVYVNLEQLDTAFDSRWLWSNEKWNIASFRRKDHLGPEEISLDGAVRELVKKQYGVRPNGPICLLTHLRYFGYIMNPVSFYLCWAEAGNMAEFIVAEINNTPWGERYCYVLDCRTQAPGDFSFTFDKAFHVSPFHPMNQQYEWKFKIEDESLAIDMVNMQNGERVFEAHMNMQRKPMNTGNMGWMLLRHPLMTMKVVSAIYYQAFKLWVKKVPFHPHPKHSESS